MFQEMELSSPKIKKFVIFSQKKAFLIFPEMESCSKKKKKIHPEKTCYIFSKENLCYISENGNHEKNSLYLRRWNFS